MALADDLADAKAKYHSLLTGTLAKVFVDQNGERIEYNVASAPRLSAYIQELERQIAGVSSGPMRVWL